MGIGCPTLVVARYTFSTETIRRPRVCFSHAPLYWQALGIADPVSNGEPELDALTFNEAEVKMGVRRVPLRNFALSQTRICRAVSPTPADIETVVAYATARLGFAEEVGSIAVMLRSRRSLPRGGAAVCYSSPHAQWSC